MKHIFSILVLVGCFSGQTAEATRPVACEEITIITAKLTAGSIAMVQAVLTGLDLSSNTVMPVPPVVTFLAGFALWASAGYDLVRTCLPGNTNRSKN